jgi:hypothetical protein
LRRTSQLGNAAGGSRLVLATLLAVPFYACFSRAELMLLFS